MGFFRREEGDGAAGVAVIRFERPPANTIDLAVTEEFGAFLGELERAPPKALVLTGSGSAFSAGLDLKTVPTYGPEQRRALVEMGCAAGQGHLFARALPIDELMALLVTGVDGVAGRLARPLS